MKAKRKVIHVQAPGLLGSSPPPVGQGEWLCDGSDRRHARPKPDELTYNISLATCRGCLGKVRQSPGLYNALEAARQPSLPLVGGAAR